MRAQKQKVHGPGQPKAVFTEAQGRKYMVL
jgi:hypothetical protein